MEVLLECSLFQPTLRWSSSVSSSAAQHCDISLFLDLHPVPVCHAVGSAASSHGSARGDLFFTSRDTPAAQSDFPLSFLPPSGRCNESAGHGQMMDVETSYSDFINCDRTGRRNAVPDITGEGEGAASTSELTKDLAEMDLKAAGQ